MKKKKKRFSFFFFFTRVLVAIVFIRFVLLCKADPDRISNHGNSLPQCFPTTENYQ